MNRDARGRLLAPLTLLLICWGCDAEPQKGAPEGEAPAKVDAAKIAAQDAEVKAAPDAAAEATDAGDAAPIGDGGDLPKIVQGEFKIEMGAMQVEEEAPAAVPPTKKKPTKKTAKRKVKKKPAPKKATPKRSGGSVMKTIRAHWGEVESCYGAVASKDPSIGGKIVMQWTLSADGKPSAARVKKDTLSDKSVGKCIARKSKAWSFPPPSGGVGVVSYTYRLRMQ